jgi:hypothetical protein
MKHFWSRLTAFISSDASVPWILLAVAVLSYGLLIPFLGFFWDDFPLAWIFQQYGVDGLERYFSTNRPYWGWLFQVSMPLLGIQPWRWHLYGLFWRWLSSVLLWKVLRRTLPDAPQVALWASLLFLVYPGFQQQHIPIIFGHLFLVLCLYLLSLYLNIIAIELKSRKSWIIQFLAMVLSLYQMLAMEYFFLLELLRPAMIWQVLKKDSSGKREHIRRTLQSWLPYLVLFIIALTWRSFFFRFQTHNYQMSLLQEVRTAPGDAMLKLIAGIARSFWVVIFEAWGTVFRLPDVNVLGMRTTILTAGVVLVTLVLVGIYLTLWRRGQGERLNSRGSMTITVIGLGTLALFLGGGPSWLIDVLPRLIFALDRFTLPFLVGVTLLISGVLGWLPLHNWVRMGLVILLVILAVGRQFQVSNAYRRDWETQQRFFWQLAWRIPNLTPGTMLLVNQLPVTYYTDNSLTAPLNWFWAPTNRSLEMSYLLSYPEQRLGLSLTALDPGVPVNVDYLAAKFSGNTSQVVAVFYDPPACLRVLDPGVDFDNKMLPDAIQAAALLSSTRWISLEEPAASERLPAFLYGEEPAHGWCYYFSMAEIARQQRDWQRVAALGDQAFNLGDYPNDPAERLVFLEGYAHTGQWVQAEVITDQSLSITPMMEPVLCHLWERIAQDTPPSAEKISTLERVYEVLNCSE